MQHFDLIIIGAGPAGLSAARAASRRNLRTAVVSREPAGGTCLHRGCIPVKALLAHAGQGCTDWQALHAHANAATEKMAHGASSVLANANTSVFTGDARMLTPNRILIALQDSAPVEISADRILLVPGSSPAFPAFLPQSPRILDSDAMLSLRELPSRLVVIGGGAVGCEFASLLADLGVTVEVVERAPRILPSLDRDCGITVAGAFTRRGIRIHTGVELVSANEENGHLQIVAADGHVFDCDAALVATGRRPATDKLGLAEIGIKTGPRGEIVVDNAFRTNVQGVSACGDAVGKIQLATWAEASAEAAVAALCGEEHSFDGASIPSCVFSCPEVASVGMTEDEARARGLSVRIGKSFARANGRAVATGETCGFAKAIIDNATGQLLGASIVGLHASEAIAAAALAVRNHLPADSLIGIFPHPVFGETLSAAIRLA